MGHWNMRYTGPVIDMEMNQQGQGHFLSEPCVLYRSMTNFPQPNVHTTLPATGSRTSFDLHHLPEHHGTSSYGMTQYNCFQHQYPAGILDLAVPTVSNHYNMYMTPSGARVFPAPLNHGPHDQFPLSSNHGIVEVSTYSYGRNIHFMDGPGGSFKRKNGENLSRNFQFCYASAGSSSSAGPMNARPLESDVASVDAASFAVPDSRGNDALDVGSHRSLRNRSGAIGVESVLANNTNYLIQGHYPGQPFQTAGTPWLDRHFNGNTGDIGTLSWNQTRALPHLHGNFIGGGMEAANMGVQGYQVSASNRSSAAFLPPIPIPQGHVNIHHHPLAMQGTQGHNFDLHSQVATSSRNLLTSSTAHMSMNLFQDFGEAGPRYMRPVPPSELRTYRSHRREMMVEESARQLNLPHLRVLPEDGVALLELSDYHEIDNSIDHHQDMRLDIDHMSYEELLALEEHIGSVGNGLSEETIISRLKLRTFVLSTSSSVDQELNFCVICQGEYKDQDKIGSLECGHEYHVECIKKWLPVKNTCPICKSPALTTERKES